MRFFPISILLLTIISCRTNHLATVKLNGNFGCIDKHGQFVIQPTWDWMLQGSRNKQILVSKDSLYGFVDKRGEIIVEPKYKDANIFYEGLAAVGDGKKYGFINIKGDTVIPLIFDDIFLGFSKGLSDVTRNDSCGYIDKKGKTVIQFKYETCYPFLSDHATVETFDGKTLLINKQGQHFQYDKEKHNNIRLWALNTYPGSFQTESGRGRVNEKGDIIIPPIYSSVSNFIEGRSVVELNKLWGVYDDKGKLLVKPQYENLMHFSEGLAAFKLNDKWGYIDKQGKVVIKNTYEYVGPFSNGLAYVEVKGKVGFIDKKGRMAIEPRFEINRSSKFE